MNPEPHILLLESSGDACSAAISKGMHIIAEKTVYEKNVHSAYLASFVRDLLDDVAMPIKQLDACAISAGPGSYTGLRIGSSLAKGICYALNIPLIAVSTLMGLASAAQKKMEGQSFYGGIIDARRNDAYIAVYDTGWNPVIDEMFCTLDTELISRLENFPGLVLGGNACTKLQETYNVHFTCLPDLQLTAADLHELAYKKYQLQKFEELAYFEPNYIKSVHITTPKNLLK